MTALVLVRSDTGDGGWSLHPPGSTDEQIADGSAPALLTGKAECDPDLGRWTGPTVSEYAEAMQLLIDNPREDE